MPENPRDEELRSEADLEQTEEIGEELLDQVGGGVGAPRGAGVWDDTRYIGCSLKKSKAPGVVMSGGSTMDKATFFL